MTLHLIKLCVGPQKLSDLADRQAQRLKEQRRNRRTPELLHITRNTPRRAEEVLAGGSLYWVIKGWICARQKLLELRPVMRDGTPHCALVYDKELVRVEPRPRRAFQGWRYLEAKDAPPDWVKRKGESELPYEMQRELKELGLL